MPYKKYSAQTNGIYACPVCARIKTRAPGGVCGSVKGAAVPSPKGWGLSRACGPAKRRPERGFLYERL